MISNYGNLYKTKDKQAAPMIKPGRICPALLVEDLAAVGVAAADAAFNMVPFAMTVNAGAGYASLAPSPVGIMDQLLNPVVQVCKTGK